MPSRCLATRYASLRVPQCSVFSILAPFSEQATSTTCSTFLISSSGVAGRMMKIRSYRRSSMFPRFFQRRHKSHRYKTKTVLRRGVFALLAFAPVVLRHRRFDPLGQEKFDGVARLSDHLGGDFQLRLLHRPQDIFLTA